VINVAENELLMRCSCHSAEHIAWLIHDPDESRGNNLKGEHDDWYLSVMLDHFSFWKRVRKAFRYVFAPQTIKYGMTAELVLRTEDIDKLYEFILVRRALPAALPPADHQPTEKTEASQS
jgi:hypothetical protein